jgi:cyanophycinase-like exopeptidase
MNIIKLFFLIFTTNLAYAQGFTSFITGNANDASSNPEFGICLMGGSSENDQAMQWFLNLADGGDVLVLRTSGGDGYNDYMFNQLGVNLNSVETILINQASGATSPYVLQKISQAEAIWFAGGDQADYVNFFKDNAVENLLHEHISIKQYPIGGISAGMAIMGEYYFDALNGTITSSEALSNPFDNRISLGVSDFIDNPYLTKTITDTHYDNPDREGRHMAFLARLQAISGERVYGIGIDEFTSVCIDKDGYANIYGEFPNFDDFAYFIQVNCLDNMLPENLAANQNLDWNLNQKAVKAYKVAGNINGSNQFNLNTWEDGIGGEWQNWWIDQGSFQSQNSTSIDCDTFSNEEFDLTTLEIYPNPTKDIVNIESKLKIYKAELYNLQGEKIKSIYLNDKSFNLNMNVFQKGIYFLKVFTDDNSFTFKLIKD